jgi:hypothetical protein
VNDIFKPGAGIVFMKVGVHAREPLEDIIARKSLEIKEAGLAMWGYGGNTCHPRTMVQPFAEDHVRRHSPIYLCMEEMKSSHWAEPVIAAQFSVNGEDWKDIHERIHVRGSRYALIIDSLVQEEFDLPLVQTKVAVGLNRGRSGARYISGRVDKACLEVVNEPENINEKEVRNLPISIVARLTSPYAVFLRGAR